MLVFLFVCCCKSYCQKTYNLTIWDNAIFMGKEHSRWFDFNNMPVQSGKYVVYDYKQITRPGICGVFYIDEDGRLGKKTEYGCCFEEMDMNDKNKIGPNTACLESDVFIYNDVITYEYKDSELNKVTIQAFLKNGRFNKAIRKQVSRKGNSPFAWDEIFHTILLKYTELPCSNDYEIILKNKDTFRITNIATTLYKPQDTAIGNFCTMYSYEINGKKMVSSFITLVKPGYEEEYIKYTGR